MIELRITNPHLLSKHHRYCTKNEVFREVKTIILLMCFLILMETINELKE